MKQSNEVQEMNHQRRICAFQENHRYEQEQNQKDAIFHIKETLHMNWTKPNLNAQKNYLALTLSLQLLSPLLFYVCFCCCCCWGFFAFVFHLLSPLSLMLIIGIIYCLNYTLLLLHLITQYHIFLFYLLFSLPLR